MSNFDENIDVLSMFGLTVKQTRILFSIEKLLVLEDIKNSKNKCEEKRKWLTNWERQVSNYIAQVSVNSSNIFMSKAEILEAIKNECRGNINNTWYYLIILEATLFVPYTPLSEKKEENKFSTKLKYMKQTETIKEIVRSSSIMDESFVDRFERTYSKTINKLTGKTTKIALGVVIVIATAAIVAATAGIFAGPIAVGIYGSEFVGLSGAALTSACLAMAGGGAIAVGGAGMAGGVFAIVGGGALLGLAAGGSAVVGAAAFLTASPQLALTQAAKLEVVLKEIVINAQKDIVCAQKILENYKSQIEGLNRRLTKLKLERQEDKEAISNLKKSLEYLEKAYQDMRVFVSSYEVGRDNEKGKDRE